MRNNTPNKLYNDERIPPAPAQTPTTPVIVTNDLRMAQKSHVIHNNSSVVVNMAAIKNTTNMQQNQLHAMKASAAQQSARNNVATAAHMTASANHNALSSSHNHNQNHNNNNNATEKLIAGKYRLIKKIGSGSFGAVYHGYNISNNREVAVKIELDDVSSSQLVYESKVYNVLSDGKHVPFSKLYNTSDHEKALVIDLLGPSLEDFFAFCDRKFSMKTVCMLGDQLITVIEYVHQNSIIHCDIKPDNFLMGLDHNCNRVFIIDFGLSKQYQSGPQHLHTKYNNNRSLTGTARYVSINAHIGISQSRRDDLESIGYVLVYFCVQCLPWQGIDCRGKKQKYDRICEKKLSTPVSLLCKNLPMEFMLYINYCRHLRFDETPDYSFIRSLFRSLLKALDEKYDLCFDWLTPKYLNPIKEYLVNFSSSFFKTMASLRSLDDVYMSPLITLKQNPVTDDSSIAKRRENYLHSFFSRYPYLDPERISFCIKNYYRCYFIVPPGLMTPVNNILRGLQSTSNSTAAAANPSGTYNNNNNNNNNTRTGFTTANNYRSNFSRSNLSKK